LLEKSKRSIALGIDIGGTGIKVAPVDTETGKLLKAPQKVATPRPATPKSMFPIISQMIVSYEGEEFIGIGFPGIIKKGVVHSAANLDKTWLGINLHEKIQRNFQQPVTVLNDADAAALAEMKFGAGRPDNGDIGEVVLMITLGTGIGSALFVNGNLVPNTEFGHVEMDGKDAEKWAATVIRERENLSWEEWSKRLNKFLNMMEMLLSPDLIIIGGGVSESPGKFLPYLNLNTRIVTAKMTNNAGIVGAALGALNPHILK
jgi:polyphosphate glucokinase